MCVLVCMVVCVRWEGGSVCWCVCRKWEGGGALSIGVSVCSVCVCVCASCLLVYDGYLSRSDCFFQNVFNVCVHAHSCLSSIVRSGKHLINCKVKLTGIMMLIK